MAKDFQKERNPANKDEPKRKQGSPAPRQELAAAEGAAQRKPKCKLIPTSQVESAYAQKKLQELIPGKHTLPFLHLKGHRSRYQGVYQCAAFSSETIALQIVLEHIFHFHQEGSPVPTGSDKDKLWSDRGQTRLFRDLGFTSKACAFVRIAAQLNFQVMQGFGSLGPRGLRFRPGGCRVGI